MWTRHVGPRTSALALAFTLLYVSWAPLARAEDPQLEDRAARAFAAGEAAFRDNRFREAAEQFDEAYRLVPHPSPLWNAAHAWAKAGERARAANLIARYLRSAPTTSTPSGGTPARARAELLELQSQIGELSLPEAEFDAIVVDGQRADSPHWYVEPGAHVVQGQRAGAVVATQNVNIAARQIVGVKLAPTTESSNVAPATPPAHPPAVDQPARDDAKPLSPWFVIGGAAISVGLGAGTVISGLDTVSFRKNHFDPEPTSANLDEGRSRQLRTNVLLAVTGGAALITAAMAIWLVDWKTGSAHVAVGANSARLEGTF